MNKTVLILLLILSKTALGQDLIYNGNFEIYDTCPVGYSDPSQTIPEIEKCTGWTHPTYGTSDYFNQCANGTNAGVNSNTLGYQEPYSGDGYLGAIINSYSGGTGDDGYNGIMWWEYIQSQLIQPMISNHTYRVGMYISLAEYSDLMIKEFGVYFSNTSISSQNTASLNVVPQVIFNNVDYFNDTIDWIYVEELYVAQGGEEFITIGNFRDNLTTDTLRRYDLGGFDLNPMVTYFFYDNVSCIDVTDSINSEPPIETLNIDIANIFTPNEDGNNDEWHVPFSLKDYEIEIYNRWGNKIITLNENNPNWNGETPNGNPVSDGIYFYILIHRKKKSKVKQGFIQLVR